jgi:hypothetical protein
VEEVKKTASLYVHSGQRTSRVRGSVGSERTSWGTGGGRWSKAVSGRTSWTEADFVKCEAGRRAGGGECVNALCAFGGRRHGAG